MPNFKIAHLHEQGQDMIIVPVSSHFGQKPSLEQKGIINDLQAHAHAANLKGTVVVVWESGGQMSFIAPPPWHPFFQGLSMYDIHCNLNKELYW